MTEREKEKERARESARAWGIGRKRRPTSGIPEYYVFVVKQEGRKKENVGRRIHETTFIVLPQQWMIITINRDSPRLSPRIGLAAPEPWSLHVVSNCRSSTVRFRSMKISR